MAASQESQNVMVDYILSKVPIRSIMSEEVKTIDPDTPIEEFLKMVTTYQHTGFPVLSDDSVVGIITLSDAKKVSQDMLSVKEVKDVMETDIVCFSPDGDADKPWKAMTKKGVGRFPIIKNDELVGIITRSDLMHAFQLQTEMSRYGKDEL